MPPKHRYSFVFLDAMGTLLHLRAPVGTLYAEFGGPLGLSATPEALEAAFRRAWPRSGEYGPDAFRRPWWRRIVGGVLAAVGFSGDAEACFEAIYEGFRQAEAWQLYPDAPPALRGLTARGIRLGLITNWDERLLSLLKQFHIRDFFDVAIIASAEGVSKPDAEIFRRAITRSNTAPHQILMIGDRLELDVVPARRLGMHARLLQRTTGPSQTNRKDVLYRLDELLHEDRFASESCPSDPSLR